MPGAVGDSDSDSECGGGGGGEGTGHAGSGAEDDEPGGDGDGGDRAAAAGGGDGGAEGAAEEALEGFLCAAGGYLAAQAGARRSQIASTTWADVELADGAAVAAAMRRAAAAPPCAAAVALAARRRGEFGRWRRELQAGCGVVLYGLGSKRGLLRELAAAALTDGAVVEVWG